SLSYSESENFQPDASRIDLLGGTIASPKGTTKDYGITFSAFDERLIFKVNRYKTVVENATAGDEIGNDYFIGAAEGWGQQYAVQAATATGSFATVYGTATGGGRLTYQPERTLEEG